MAGKHYWIRLRTNLDRDLPTVRVAQAANKTTDETIVLLYKLGAWFMRNGYYGTMECEKSTIDFHLGAPGFADALIAVDWLWEEGGRWFIGGFCDTRQRKGLGKSIRHRLLHGATCAACGSANHLVVDHVVPVSRGGSSESENLQALCWFCNAKKGRKTMQEFLAA